MLKQKKNSSELISWIKTLGMAVVFAIALRYFIFTPVVVDGASMMPTFEDQDKVIVDKIGPRITNFERFDVVVIKVDEHTNYIKRVIGLPGDHIAYKNDELYINGKKYEEPYLDAYKQELTDNGKLTADFELEDYLGESVVPEGYYFVLGDNRIKSLDSRNPSVGFINHDQIMGKVRFVISPIDRIQMIKNY